MPGSSLRVKVWGWSPQSCAPAFHFYLGMLMQWISPAVLVCRDLMSSLRLMTETGSTCEGQTQLCAQTCLNVRGWLLDTISPSEFSSSILSNEQHQINGLVLWSNCSSSLMQSNLAVILLKRIKGFDSIVINSCNRPPLGFRRETYIFNGARWLKKRLVMIDYCFRWVIPS